MDVDPLRISRLFRCAGVVVFRSLPSQISEQAGHMICPLRIGLFLMMLVGQGEVDTPESAVVLEDYAPCGLTGLYLVCRIRDVPASWPHVKPAGPTACFTCRQLAGTSRRLPPQ